MDSMHSAIKVAQNGTWNPGPGEPPYLIPFNNGLDAWPDGSFASIVFTDSSGAQLASIEGDVEQHTISFSGEPEVMNTIPHGANFVITLETNDGDVYPIRYGQVIKTGPFYTNAAASVVSPLQFADSFQRTALGKKWVTTFGRLQMVDNSGVSLPNGVAAASTTGGAAMRYWQEFTSDTVEIGVTFLNLSGSTPAWTGVTLCSDINQETGLCVFFGAGSSSARKVHVGTLTNPVTVIDQAAPVVQTVSNLDYYLIRYVDSTSTVSVYYGTALDTPLISWTDSAKFLPHGSGYRHIGANFERASTATKGIQLTSITARDAS